MFEDACQLFEAFRRSPWRQLDLDCAQMQLSITRFSAAERAASEKGVGLKLGSGKADDTDVFRAPHVATLRSVVPVGATLLSGDSYAVIEVLGKHIELRSSKSAEVVAHLARPGELIEYMSPVVEVASIGA